MDDLIIRSEELDANQIREFYVEADGDRRNIEYLKSKTPIILVGSRGIGKTFLMRKAEQELMDEYSEKQVLPIFITFRRAALVNVKEPSQFQTWMLARICSVVIRTLTKLGRVQTLSKSIAKLTGEKTLDSVEATKIEKIATQYEELYRKPDMEIDDSVIPTADELLDAIEDLCIENAITRIVLFIDEAAHALYAEQQRQFFTLFRDLRSQYITCNAAVYPGVTAYGETFQPTHDATIISINRNIEDVNYVRQMKDIVLKQITDSNVITNLSRNGQNFTLLAYAASGNPRTLLKTVSYAQKLNSDTVNRIFREYYKTNIWAEHTGLAEAYPNYSTLIDWGRNFIETIVLKEIKSKNDNYTDKGKPSSAYFWVDKNVSQIVKEALRLLEYTGIIYENSKGIRATREGIGTRYLVNVGCLISLEAVPTTTGYNIVQKMTIKRMTEFSVSYPFFKELEEQVPNFQELTTSVALKSQLERNVDCLELTPWQIKTIKTLALYTIGDLLSATEAKLKEAPYVADIRARNIKNAAYAAVFEYLHG